MAPSRVAAIRRSPAPAHLPSPIRPSAHPFVSHPSSPGLSAPHTGSRTARIAGHRALRDEEQERAPARPRLKSVQRVQPSLPAISTAGTTPDAHADPLHPFCSMHPALAGKSNALRANPSSS
ncbi:hypothetical protein PsYK624_160800 [Phanerochaete sordida]|uniref:Uncharacterized protein n=1 Tax=Phanerochaete sordida TaxID=48140 RepID=A0A9P3GSU1_9APHY|nr:hypothetical protein PsYK624_160800 [Phanerochaete sordida]